jgi:arabinan endo-1,5-alpha-L-arabinosidase
MLRFILLSLLPWPAIALATAAPHLSANPILGGAADPTSVAGRNGDQGYFTFATAKGCQILHSTDLKNWQRIGRVFKNDAPPWARKAVPKTHGIWAPDISFHNGLYHLYYSLSSFGSQRSVIGLAVNKRLQPGHPDNKWIDRGLVIESFPGKTNFNAIDAALFVDGKDWTLFWGSFWDGIKATRLQPETGKPAKDAKIIDIARRSEDVPHRPVEAAYVIKHGDWHYLFVSWDHCCKGAKSDYKIIVGRSKKARGPYLDKSGTPMAEGGGTLLLASDKRWAGPGHNGVIQTDNGDYIVHHAYLRANPKIGRQFIIRPMTWTKDGWPELGEVMNH